MVLVFKLVKSSQTVNQGVVLTATPEHLGQATDQSLHLAFTAVLASVYVHGSAQKVPAWCKEATRHIAIV